MSCLFVYNAIPCYILIRLMEIKLTTNIFGFQDQLYRQKIGAAMGGRPAPGTIHG